MLSNYARYGAATLFILSSFAAFAAKPPVDCAKEALAKAIDKAGDGDVVTFTGICAGPILINRDGITLAGNGNAVIDGQGKDAVTFDGAQRGRLKSIEVRNGLSGIRIINGAHVELEGVNSHNNGLTGISVESHSGAVILNSLSDGNAVFGVDVETGSGVTVGGSLSLAGNRVFGMNVNGAAITFARAVVTARNNVLGMQIGTNASAFLADDATVINLEDNFSDGLTVVSGGHMVSFGGTINAVRNKLHGVALNSKGALDLDAGSVLNTTNNLGDGVQVQEGSVMTVFNIPQFSGVPKVSTINARNNSGNGISVASNSTLTFSVSAALNAQSNLKNGLSADNGSAITLVNSTLTGNTTKDLLMTFGARADLRTTTLGTWSCDVTVLVRNSGTVTCPH